MHHFLLSCTLFWLCNQITQSQQMMSNDVSNSNCFNRTTNSVDYQTITTICFNVVTGSSYSWVDAENRCQQDDGHLISITSDEEHKSIYTAQKSTGKNQCWIGLIGCNSNGMTWIDGTSYSYHDWNSGEPSTTSECCTEMYGASKSGKTPSSWNDKNCQTKFDCHICGRITNVEQILSTTAISTTSTKPSTSVTSTAPSTLSTSITSKTSTAPLAPSTKTTNPILVDDSLVSTGGVIALIILASVFFLTTLGLVVVLLIVKWKQAHYRKGTRVEPANSSVTHAVNNDSYGLEPQPSNDIMYYDIQNETVEAKINDLQSQNNEDLSVIGTNEIGQQNHVSENNFVDNQMYA